MASTLVLPALGALLADMRPCFCQPGTGQFIAIPDAGTYLVKDGRAALAPDEAPDLPFDDLISRTVRDMYEYAARTLADAPPGVELEIRLRADGDHEARLIGTYVFTRTQEAGDG